MTSLLPDSARARAGRSAATSGASAHGRPAAVAQAEAAQGAVRLPALGVGLVTGLLAAAGPLVVCLGLGVVGWFASAAGTLGAPRDGLRVGALGWLAAHGSGVRVEGVVVSMVPLGLSLLCAVVLWRLSVRAGEMLWSHGPDAARLADGERDWTVPLAGAGLLLGYGVVVGATLWLAGTPATAPSTPDALRWTTALVVLVGLPAVAVGSGRAAVRAALLSPVLRAALDLARRILVAWLLLGLFLVLVALGSDLGTAANVLAQLHTSVGEALLVSVLCLLLLPAAVLFGGAYLLGPGFAVGAGTVVSPTAVVLGPVPMVPLLAALPDTGTTPGWAPWLVVAPFALAAVVAFRAARRHPLQRWEDAVARGLGGGVAAGLLVGLLSVLAGGAVGPGRMRQVGVPGPEVTLHAVTTFGVGALVGTLVVLAWQRWSARAERAAGPDHEADDVGAPEA